MYLFISDHCRVKNTLSFVNDYVPAVVVKIVTYKNFSVYGFSSPLIFYYNFILYIHII